MLISKTMPTGGGGLGNYSVTPDSLLKLFGRKKVIKLKWSSHILKYTKI